MHSSKMLCRRCAPVTGNSLLLLLMNLQVSAASASAIATTLPANEATPSDAPSTLRISLDRFEYGIAGEEGKQTLVSAFASEPKMGDDLHVMDAVNGLVGRAAMNPFDVQKLVSIEMISEGAASAAASQHVDEVRAVMSDVADLFYTVKIGLGTPAVWARMLVDTGSADMWVRSPLYIASRSTSSVSSSRLKYVILSYWKGTVIGIELKDKACFKEMCFANQTLVEAKVVRDIGNELYIDGLLGLGFTAVKKTRGETFLTSIMRRETFKHFAFGMQLHSNGTSYLAFGEYEKVLAEAPKGTEGLVLPVTKGSATTEPLFWMLRTEIRDTVGFSTTAVAILDSGTSLLSVPTMHFRFVVLGLFEVEQLRRCTVAMGFIVCPCTVRMRPITFTFTSPEGRAVSVSLAADDLLGFVGTAVIHGAYTRVCRLGVAPSPINVWLLGDSFLRRVYTVHDVALERLVIFPQRPEDAVYVRAPSSDSRVETNVENRFSAHGFLELASGLIVAAYMMIVMGVLSIAIRLLRIPPVHLLDQSVGSAGTERDVVNDNQSVYSRL
eukprot:TRINITY_DN9819_c0_g1_i4.p1 TRINITY_DN9819_c0_g1~~TRINITY_DN9819_c0_g1_i4.p1  ORF type:complete len:553 (+),score=76.72 TRINITY_DN9819_c0_g1_i4:61-1719(+)